MKTLTPLTYRHMIDAQVHNMKTAIMGPQNDLNTVLFQCTSSAVCVYTRSLLMESTNCR